MSSLEARPTGVQNIEQGLLDVVDKLAVAGIEYQVGDIIVQSGDSGSTEGAEASNCIPVQSMEADTIANQQVGVSDNFLGISIGYISNLNLLHDVKLPIATRGRVRLDCVDVTAFPMGSLVAVHCDSGGGAYIPKARTVEYTQNVTKAIGRTCADKAAADTTVLVEFRSVVINGAVT